MNYNPQKHKRKSTRLEGYDYSKEGMYFVTICTHKRFHLFGHIENGAMFLNDAGKFADQCWNEIPAHFPHAVLHEYVVMPNHVHGILELAIDGYSDDGPEYYPPLDENFATAFASPSRTVGSIICGFKIGVTKWFRNNMAKDFPPHQSLWQRNYHDIILKDYRLYDIFSNYIHNNPAKWSEDEFFSL
jgi:putative transposase